MEKNTKLYIRNKWVYHTPQLKLDECVDNAMDEYAKEVALHFDYWKNQNFRKVMPNGYESNIIDGTKNYRRRYTIHELFEQYKKENT